MDRDFIVVLSCLCIHVCEKLACGLQTVTGASDLFFFSFFRWGRSYIVLMTILGQ